jgi:hypothetical protein
MREDIMDRRATDSDHSTPAQHMMVGTGIALAGICLASSAAAVLLALIAFVWTDQTVPADVSRDVAGWAAVLTLLLVAAPMIAGFVTTMRILGRD